MRLGLVEITRNLAIIGRGGELSRASEGIRVPEHY